MDTKTQKRKRLKQLCSDYDAAVKRILTKKYVLAHILKGCTDEFSDCSIEEIVEKHLTFDPIYGETAVDEDETNAELAAKVTSSEHATTSEGKVVFDTRFEVLAPNTKRPIGLIINIEGQRQSKLRYPLTKRALYYCSRLISSQKGRNFKHDHYDDIQKVYSIWICTNPKCKNRGTIQRYSIAKEDLFGNVDVPKREYDLMVFMIVNVGNSKSPNYNGLLKMLSLLFCNQDEQVDASQILEIEYGYPKAYFEPEVFMKSWAHEIVVEAEEKGLKKGLRRGRKEGHEKGRKEGRIEGIKEGIEKGKIAGGLEQILVMTKRVMSSLSKTLDDAMAILELTEEEKAYVRRCLAT